MSDTTPFIWTNDDVSFNHTPHLQKMLDLLDGLEIPGVFFVIPRTGKGTIDQDVELCRTIEKARGNGHEFYQHGYVHTPFESGVPETWMLDFAPDKRERYDSYRLEIEATHTLEKMVEKIEAGQRIWRAAFGESSPGYRPGWGAFCVNMYKALEVLGFEWVSSRICPITSWLWNQELWTQRREVRETVPGSPWQIGRLIEYPIGGDYAFRVPNEPDKIQAMADLMVEEFEDFRQRGWPVSPVSHWHGLERNDNSGYAVHENALPRIKATGQAEFMGIAELHRRTLAEFACQRDESTFELCK